MEVNGAAAIVTGGGSGLGRATAEMLALRGARVTIFDLDGETGRATAQAIDADFQQVNVSDEAAITQAIAAAAARQGVARVLVNCAGIAPAARIVDKAGSPHVLESFRRVVEVNLIGTFNMVPKVAARIVAARFEDEEAGVIINTASVAAFDGQVGQAAYASSKAAVAGLTLPAARDLAQHRIRVMAIAPGIFLTPMMGTFPREMQDSLGAQVPHPSRLGRPSEFAELVRSIVENPMLNGEVIRLDGAIRMAPR
ncbi:SDR family NAD(P)-dependent oxidoreductase [Sphingomonas nostoxanthinifaciens]|uniref:SDR family NAD(P)-dependent oxidoreductase n=1 Tax=Sphingomonas nostoxanthinifaciens TaxID=2872652 RepID=UPI001CC1EFBE|nr:SDR family NAD(P)-dependent oxidoreductase [Sphingomonas nostoxanthinifaciens]UAK23803.1 SDR family NAD(P)-dependent oxidoreductase [Sphingomonas nostoxanthinifaciens]